MFCSYGCVDPYRFSSRASSLPVWINNSGSDVSSGFRTEAACSATSVQWECNNNRAKSDLRLWYFRGRGSGSLACSSFHSVDGRMFGHTKGPASQVPLRSNGRGLLTTLPGALHLPRLSRYTPIQAHKLAAARHYRTPFDYGNLHISHTRHGSSDHTEQPSDSRCRSKSMDEARQEYDEALKMRRQLAQQPRKPTCHMWLIR